MPTMSVSGVVSGMDWDSMIDTIITKAAKPAEVQVNKKTNLQNKKSLFEEMKVTLQSLQSTLSPLKLPSTYKAKEIDIDRIDTNGSYKGVLTASVNADAIVNVYDLKVNKLATAQTNRSKQITASTIAGALNDQQLTNGKLYVNMGGRRVGIDVSSMDSLQSLKSKINNTLKTMEIPMNVTASVVDNRLILKSDSTGLGTATNTETATYGANGFNRLNTLNVKDEDLKAGRFVIRDSNSTRYKYGDDYVVVNGNEVRWRQYDESDQVKIKDSVDVKYTLAQDDVYTVTGRVGSAEAKLPFDVVDGGTLASRLKIKDSKGNTYIYGEDFTLEDGQVKWLGEVQSATTSSTAASSGTNGSLPADRGATTSTGTNEPENYTVKYEKEETVTSTIGGEKTGNIYAPSSYTMNYTTEELIPSDARSFEKTTYSDLASDNSFHRLTTVSFDDMTKLPGASLVSNGNSKYVKFQNRTEVSLIGTNGNETVYYEYGRDFVFSEHSTNHYTVVAFSNNSYFYNPYSTSGQATSTPEVGTQMRLSYKHTYRYDTNNPDSDSLPQVLDAYYSDNGNSYSGLVLTGSDGKTYKYGTNFTINASKEIEWLPVPSLDDAITSTAFSDLKAKYNTAYGLPEGTDLPTTTLMDGEGVLRTYIDPEDRSLFTMTGDDGTKYEYGRDYVIRVNDKGDGYVFTWAVTGDANGDGTMDIKDANPVVTSYMQEKGLTTYGMKASPASTEGYSFSFSKKVKTEAEGTVKVSDEDKSLAKILEDVTISPEDYSSTLTIKSGNKTYKYGRDFSVDESGNIVWTDTTSVEPDSYKVNYTAIVLQRDLKALGSNDNTTNNSDGLIGDIRTFMGYGFQTAICANDNVPSIDIYHNDSPQDYRFVISEPDGDNNYVDSEYVYGKDYVIRKSSTATAYSTVLFWRQSRINEYANYVLAHPEDHDITKVQANVMKNKPAGEYRLSLLHDYDTADTNTSELASLISDASRHYEDITITGSDGKTYTYTANADELDDDHFSIDSNGKIIWKTEKIEVIIPDDVTSNMEYTLEYSAFTPITAETVYSTNEDSSVSLVDSDGNTLTYSQILKGVGLSSSSTEKARDAVFSKMFTLSDGTDDTYEYGKDYRITAGTKDELVITWIDESDDEEVQTNGAVPANGVTLTLTYDARSDKAETYQTTLTRSAVDDIRNNNTAMDYPLYSKFNGNTITITDGKETYYETRDFTISQGADGNVEINWLNSALAQDADYVNFEDASSIIVTDGTTKYNYGTDFEILNIEGKAMMNWFVPHDSIEDFSLKVVKNGISSAYSLANGGDRIIQRALWFNQDNSEAATYTVNVTPQDGAPFSYTATRDANSYSLSVLPNGGSPRYSEFAEGSSTITQGVKTFYEGIDYEIIDDGTGRAQVEWKTDYNWYIPNPGQNSIYTINLTTKDGTEKTFTANRKYQDTLNMADLGFTTANGNISVSYNDGLGFDPELVQYKTDDDGDVTDEVDFTGNDILRSTYSFNVTRGTQGGTGTAFTFNWLTPDRTTKENMPPYGEELTIEYEYDANTFSLTDDCDGKLLAALELDQTDAAHYTAAQDAELELDGEVITRSSNDIGEDYGNELIKGMTIHLKGIGQVSLDVAHDAEKAVNSINEFMDTYNDLMQWINTRMTEKEVDKDVKATIDSDDFRMRWGLLHGNSLLRNTKSNMRNIMAQSFTYTFTQRTSAEEVYGNMGLNGLRNTATLRLRVGSKYVDVTVDPTDTLQDIVDKISDSSDTAMRNIYYGDDGKLLDQPLIRASINNDKLVISSTNNEQVTMSGSSAMKALKMNYTYTGLFQLGLTTTSTDYGKSGELEFDESKFMEALEDNPDEVQELMLMFANNMDTWVKSMLMSSASGETSGTLTRQIEDLDTQIASIDEYLEKYQERLDRQEESLRKRYASAENQFYKMSQQANSIAAILNQLNGYANSNNSSGS